MEVLRKAIRTILGYDSRVYRAGSGFLNFISITSSEGLKTWRLLSELKNPSRFGEPAQPVVLRQLHHPIYIRPGTVDATTVTSNVIRAEYGCFMPTQEPQWMIDAGAYIGDTTVYFLSRFPKLRVIALEPNPENHDIARRNLQPYGERVILLQKGLYGKDEDLHFSGNQTTASITGTGNSVSCVSIASLLNQYAISHLDILKMDIEGAEEPVFSSSPQAWLGRVERIIMEIHGSRIETLINDVLRKNGFVMNKYRSVWYCQPDGPMRDQMTE